MKILIRNLHRRTTETQMRALFEPFGTVESCDLVLDEKTGKSKGFGFVVMASSEEGAKAIKELNGVRVEGAKIRVKVTNK